jgi:hypothetical protein
MNNFSPVFRMDGIASVIVAGAARRGGNKKKYLVVKSECSHIYQG